MEQLDTWLARPATIVVQRGASSPLLLALTLQARALARPRLQCLPTTRVDSVPGSSEGPQVWDYFSPSTHHGSLGEKWKTEGVGNTELNLQWGPAISLWSWAILISLSLHDPFWTNGDKGPA